jgi:hypothetical protein
MPSSKTLREPQKSFLPGFFDQKCDGLLCLHFAYSLGTLWVLGISSEGTRGPGMQRVGIEVESGRQKAYPTNGFTFVPINSIASINFSCGREAASI